MMVHWWMSFGLERLMSYGEYIWLCDCAIHILLRLETLNSKHWMELQILRANWGDYGRFELDDYRVKRAYYGGLYCGNLPLRYWLRPGKGEYYSPLIPGFTSEAGN